MSTKKKDELLMEIFIIMLGSCIITFSGIMPQCISIGILLLGIIAIWEISNRFSKNKFYKKINEILMAIIFLFASMAIAICIGSFYVIIPNEIVDSTRLQKFPTLFMDEKLFPLISVSLIFALIALFKKNKNGYIYAICMTLSCGLLFCGMIPGYTSDKKIFLDNSLIQIRKDIKDANENNKDEITFNKQDFILAFDNSVRVNELIAFANRFGYEIKKENKEYLTLKKKI